WVGLANYQSLFTTDETFRTAAWITVKFAIVAVPIGIIAGVGLALLLNANVKGIALYRTVFFLPSIVPTVATTAIFIWILNPQIGLVNGLLSKIGIVGPAWLNDPKWALWSLMFMGLWGVGNSMVIYLAGLKDIPNYLYEAATVDGATPLQKLSKITLPMLTPVIFFNLVMGVIGSLQYFTQAYIMTGGGPEDSTRFYALYLFDRAWRYADMGYASAMAWILFLAIVLLTVGLFGTQKRWVHYGS
ncbi:MAG TPA: sugar ABC transporter permease, partial [Roseimicrobium sp.]|nr:sugar ABC transporter permease [Roseimicrobium sp.]